MISLKALKITFFNKKFLFSLVFVLLGCTLYLISNNEPVPTDTKIFLKRGSVWGKSYSFTVYGNGKVKYDGKLEIATEEEKNAKDGIKLGRYEREISKDRISKILRKIKNVKYFSLENTPCQGYQPTDPSWTEIKVLLDGKSKSVTTYYECNKKTYKSVLQIADSIENIVGIEEWIK